MKLKSMNSLRNSRQTSRLGLWLAQHDLIVFYILVFFFTWTIVALLAAFPPENPTAFTRIVLISSYAPALVALYLLPQASPAPAVSTTLPAAKAGTSAALATTGHQRASRLSQASRRSAKSVAAHSRA